MVLIIAVLAFFQVVASSQIFPLLYMFLNKVAAKVQQTFDLTSKTTQFFSN